MAKTNGGKSGLLLRAVIGGLCLPPIFGLLVFVPAQSFHYWQGWMFLAIWFFSFYGISIDLVLNDSDLLARRLRRKETRPKQKWALLTVKSFFAPQIVLSAWSGHLGALPVPSAVAIGGGVGMAAGFLLMLKVLRSNRYAGATVVVEEGQTVAEKGPYALVRHPYYTSMCVLFVACPIALGSTLGLALAVPLIAAIIVRLLDEEDLLIDELPGYKEYAGRVPYRLVPRIW